MARSLNRVQLIGNLTRDPELRYTPSGAAVCSFSIATNRNWTTDAGEKREEVDFHRIVAWNKLAELCSQFLVKGRKVYVEGRLTNRSWTAQDGTQRNTTEIVIDDMILLDSRRQGEEGSHDHAQNDNVSQKMDDSKSQSQSVSTKTAKKKEEIEKSQKELKESEENISPDDIPF
ncbi:MAG: single-stranded DNA-binding protein [Patescibacteria group bacterium]|nr:single-stranded DNA-binding protein [Patescibacteria group bacterium]